MERNKLRKRFYSFARAASYIAAQYSKDPAISLNPVLHVTRHYGPFVELEKQFSNSTLIANLRDLLRFSVRVLQATFRAFGTSERSSRFHEQHCGSEYDVLILTHADQITHFKDNEDFYFGKLHQDLIQSGLTVCYLCTNKNRIFFDIYLTNTLQTYSSVTRWILRNKVGVLSELRYVIMVLRASITGFFSSFRESDPQLSKMLMFMAARSFETIPVLRLSEQVREFCKKSKVKYLVYTFEGHAWECAAIYGARSVCRDITCIGYQHSSIFPLQYSARTLVLEDLRPDYIFCSGESAVRYFRGSLSRDRSIRLIKAGRLKGGEVEGRLSENLKKRNDYGESVDLIALLSGESEDYKIVVRFLCSFSLQYPDFRIKIRPHPLSDESCIRFFLKQARGSNIHISKYNLKLEEDLFGVRCAIYTDTTAIALAIQMGCHPIFLSIVEAMSINSLHLARSVPHSSVSTFESLNSVLTTQHEFYDNDCAPELTRIWDTYNYRNVSEVFIEKQKKGQ